MEQRLWAGLSLSMAITSFATATDSTFPFVTGPNFERTARPVLSLARAVRTLYAPLVSDADRLPWEQYTKDHFYSNKITNSTAIEHGICVINNTTLQRERDMSAGPYLPIWQQATAHTSIDEPGLVMWNQLSCRRHAKLFNTTLKYKTTAVMDPVFVTSPMQSNSGAAESASAVSALVTQFTPVLDNKRENTVAGVIGVTVDLESQYQDALQGNAHVVVVHTSPCATFSMEVFGPDATFLGQGDRHDDRYEGLGKQPLVLDATNTRFRDVTAAQREYFFGYYAMGSTTSTSTGASSNETGCPVTIEVYPTKQYRDSFHNKWSNIVPPLVCAMMFLINLALFLSHDRLVRRRQRMVEKAAHDANAIVNSLFPAVFRDRLMRSQSQQQESTATKEIEINPHNFMRKIRGRKVQVARAVPTTKEDEEDAPIAELFTNTTIMFADIAGFTAWSSEREPAQVFELLESMYYTFDVVAKRLGVFKIETIGDCYVCVTGLPKPNKDHAVVMARFAYECILQAKQLTKELDASLGPGTSDLALRIGLHSGSVIAGVLRGEKSRFQLFGDTMNTASRMESNGERNKIQVSQATADLIIAGGKGHWLTARADLIKAKGKGDLQTYWLTPQRRSKASEKEVVIENVSLKSMASRHKVLADAKAWKSQSTSTSRVLSVDTSTDSLYERNESFNAVDLKYQRLIDWNTEILCSLLSKLVSSRNSSTQHPMHSHGGASASSTRSVNQSRQPGQGYPAISSIGERIHNRSTNPLGIVRDELRQYVGRIAALYRSNTFHNFEHASHVALSANKLLKRIISPTSTDDCSQSQYQSQNLSQSTYGISSDPLLQFVIVLSALVHDCDHPGVPNDQLVKEMSPLVAKYDNKSVAERHSVSLALTVLSEAQFRNLQACIYPTKAHYLRFRDLLINAVLATDISDKELKLNRQMRWTAAFHSPVGFDDPTGKAAIVVDHIIQASDVAHTMQHWHIFRKWNAKLFNEMYDAYIDGRSDTDPGLKWYENELGFFDFYVIPLAKKLKECGVFGISSDEYLNYALANRLEWEHRGREVTDEMIAARQAEEECSTTNVEPNLSLTRDFHGPNAVFAHHIYPGQQQHNRSRTKSISGPPAA